MLVSVIMPAYNSSPYIEQAIRSLLAQPQRDMRLDIIVIDDGSSDDTAGVVRGVRRQHSEVRLISAPHCGISVARNHGLDALPAEAHFVTFHDSDDIAYPGRIERQLALLRSDSNVQVVYGLLQIFDVWDNETLSPSKTGRTMTTRGISLSAGLFRRTIIEQIGRFDESLIQAEDTDFLFRLVESGANIHTEEEIATYYRRHDTNTTRDVAVGRREFMKAIHKSMKRRRPADRHRIAALCNGMFADRRKFEEQFEECPVNTQS